MTTYLDDFNRADQNLTDSANWSVDAGTNHAVIANNRVVLTGEQVNRYYRYTPPAALTYPYTVSAKVTATSQAGRFAPVGANCVAADGGSGYYATIDKTNDTWTIVRRTGGSGFVVGETTVDFSTVPEPAPPYDVSLTVDVVSTEPVLTLIVNGQTVIDSVVDPWGARIQAGEPGMYWVDGDTTFAVDDFSTSDSTADSTAPTVSALAVNGDAVTITLDESIQLGADGVGGLTITGSAAGAVTLAGASASGSQITATASASFAGGETVTWGYTQPGDGIKDVAGNLLATVAAGQGATNNTGVALGTLTFGVYSGASTDDPLSRHSGGFNYRVWTDAFVDVINGAGSSDGANDATIQDAALTPGTTYKLAINIPGDDLWEIRDQTAS